MMAAQCSIGLVKHLKGAALATLAFPSTSGAIKHGRVTSSVEKDENLLRVDYFFSDCTEQWAGEQREFWLKIHIHSIEFW